MRFPMWPDSSNEEEEEAGYLHKLSLSCGGCLRVRQLLDTKSCGENMDDPVVLGWLFRWLAVGICMLAGGFHLSDPQLFLHCIQISAGQVSTRTVPTSLEGLSSLPRMKFLSYRPCFNFLTRAPQDL